MAAEAAGPLQPTAEWLGRLRGGRRAAAALALGALGAAAMPPFNLVPLLIPSFCGLIWLIDAARSPRRAFLDGWLWGFGFFVPSLYWVALSMFVDIGQFWWMVPFSVFGLPSLLAIYTGLATWATRLASPARSVARVLALAGWWTLGEWLRGHLLSGFPWLLTAYTWSGESPVLLAGLQIASLAGVYGLSLLTVLVCGCPAILGWPGSRRRQMLAIVLPTILTAAGLAWGSARLASGPDPAVRGATIRIVSTDFPHRPVWDPAAEALDFRTLLGLAQAPGLDKVAAEVWPEGAVAAALNRDTRARQAVAGAAPPDGLVITGTLRADGQQSDLQVWNAVAVVNAAGELIGSYDKHHLVPFGEYVPFHSLLSFNPIVALRLDFSVGPGPETIPLPNLPAVAPIICYEAIFPGEVVDETHPPGWMLNVTDDGWFGRSIGPRQHFAIARVRAVEEGLPLVRSANGGISGLVDAHGRDIALLPVGRVGILDVTLPARLQGRTLFVRSHGALVPIFIVVAISAGYVLRRLA